MDVLIDNNLTKTILNIYKSRENANILQHFHTELVLGLLKYF